MPNLLKHKSYLSEQVGKFLQLVATFIGGFVIAFVKGWLLTAVMMTTLPLLVLSGAAMAVIMGRMTSEGQTAYAKAAHIVEQTIGSIRTVCCY
ncbi:putative xenobiotic-transporting ATPase [Lupinus albus]|uniref:Putative xenobiotic-transporting ATPase n=1 Tax=Lupinus albus TaxID=3870 RepID=A0A6A4QZ05_LUPAL|nr:putative xenobiotic-transporting ATPase [Lupinus albus]